MNFNNIVFSISNISRSKLLKILTKEIVENNGLNENIRLLLQLFSKDEALKYLDAG